MGRGLGGERGRGWAVDAQSHSSRSIGRDGVSEGAGGWSDHRLMEAVSLEAGAVEVEFERIGVTSSARAPWCMVVGKEASRARAWDGGGEAACERGQGAGSDVGDGRTYGIEAFRLEDPDRRTAEPPQGGGLSRTKVFSPNSSF
jgi:hypothetical protein